MARNDEQDEQMAETVELLKRAADEMDERGGASALVTELREAAFELHRSLDPHCTCNDCLGAMDEDDAAARLHERYTAHVGGA